MKRNMALRLAALLFCMVLISTCMVSGMLARYVTEDTSAQAAQVAKFGDLILTEPDSIGTILPGTAIPMNAQVTMGASEVAVRIYVTLNLDNTWTYQEGKFSYSDILSFAPNTGWTYEKTEAGQSRTTYTFYQDIAPNTQDQAIFLLLEQAIQVSPTVSYETYYNTVPNAMDIRFGARAVQID